MFMSNLYGTSTRFTTVAKITPHHSYHILRHSRPLFLQIKEQSHNIVF